MTHFIYCQSPRNLSAGGTVGYLTRLEQSFLKYRPTFTTDLGVDINFEFATKASRQQYIDRFLIDEERIYNNKLFDFLTRQKVKLSLKEWKIDNKCRRWFRETSRGASFITDDEAKSIHINGVYSFFPIWNRLKLKGQERNTLKILTTHNPAPPM